MHLWVGLPDVR